MKVLATYFFPYAKFPAVRIAVLLSFGIVLSNHTGISSHIWLALLAISLITYSLASLNLHPAGPANIKFYRLSIILYLLSIFLFGTWWQSARDITPLPFGIRFLQTMHWEKAIFKGVIVQIRESSSGKYHLDVSVDTTFTEDSLLINEPFRMRAILTDNDTLAIENLRLGSRITYRATIYPLANKRNPHEFDYKKYLSGQNIQVQAGVDSIMYLNHDQRTFSWETIRQAAIDLIDQNFRTETAPIAKALLIGYKNELSKENKLAFSRAGLSHIMAVSGLHVGFLLAPFWFVIPYFWTYTFGRQTGLGFLIVLLFFYAGLTGFSASVIRASITGGLIMYARLFNKIRDSVNLTAVAAIILLLINPSELFEIGFQLSFGAVYIILLTLPVINKLLPNRLQYSSWGSLLSIVLVSVNVQAGLYPLLGYYFGEFSIIGPLANAVVVPFLGMVVPLALALLLVSALHPVAGYYLNLPNDFFLDHLNRFVIFISSLEWSWIQTPPTDLLLFLLWITAIFFIAALNIPRIRWKLLILLLVLLCMQQTAGVVEQIKKPGLEVTIFDVGQGDAALITTPGKKNILIDVGRWSPSFNSGRSTILPHLRAAGIRKLEAIILSHPHADHIGGITDLIENIPIDTIYNSGFNYDSQLYHTYQKLAATERIPVVSLQAGIILEIDTLMRIFIYGPGKSITDEDPNEHSVVLELVYGTTEFLFMGDAGEKQEHSVIESYGNFLNTDFLKVGHHGSRTSSSLPFLQIASPDISVVSLEKTNKFRHPHPEAVTRLKTTRTSIYYTSLQGALVFTSDGNNIHYNEWE